MKIKTVEINGKVYAELSDGMPVYVHDDGKEIPFDAPGTVTSLNSRIAQNQRVEGENKTLKEQLKAFDGISDADAARKALATVANLDQKKLIDAGEVERVKQEIAKGFEAQITERDEKIAELNGTLNSELIGGRFTRSKTVAEKLAIPADLVQAKFGNQFKVEDGKVVAHDANGQKIYSRSKPGELADFDEALDIIIDQYPMKEHILKAAGSGGGAGGASSGAGGKGKFEPGKLGGTPEERAAAFKVRFPDLQA